MTMFQKMLAAAMVAAVLAAPVQAEPDWRAGLTPITPAEAQRQFEKLKALAGRWEGSSTQGWKNTMVIRVIARGSAVLQTSEFQDELGEGMATLYFMDRGRLMLTHYCEARNQPTLAANGVSADGKRISFAFLSGTGMANREQGHMDSVVMRIPGASEHSSRWTWYANGKESWMEDIRYRRIADAATANGR